MKSENKHYSIDINKLPILDKYKDMTSDVYNFYTDNELQVIYVFNKSLFASIMNLHFKNICQDLRSDFNDIDNIDDIF